MVVNPGRDTVDYYLALAGQTLKAPKMLVKQERDRASEPRLLPGGLEGQGVLPDDNGEHRCLLLDPGRTVAIDGGALSCTLTELDGASLGIARCSFKRDRGSEELNASGFDQPGRVVTRCLLGDVRVLLVRLPNGDVVRARVKRVSFEPGAGRVVTLQIEGSVRDDVEGRVRKLPKNTINTQHGGDA